MKILKITQEQLNTLAESTNIDKSFVKATKNSGIQTLSEEPFDIKKPIAGISDSRINEDIFSPELHAAISNLITNIWQNGSQSGLDKIFVDNGITWGDITTYLTSVGILTGIGSGMYKVNNFFKRKFSKNPETSHIEKKEEIEKIASKIQNDPESPWAKKLRLQSKPESDWKAEPKKYNPNRFKPMEEASNYPPGTENDPNSPWMSGPEPRTSKSKVIFKCIAMGKELAMLVMADKSKYLFDLDAIDEHKILNPEYQIDEEEITNYVNDNLDILTIGKGLEGFYNNSDIVLIDDELRDEVSKLYSRDTKFISALNGVDETMSSSSGAFVSKLSEEEEIIDETTTSASSGSYVQPKIWAKDKNNWGPSKKTQYPNGEMVSFDNCTKLNNNTKAKDGKCSQGSVDGVVKTKKTSDSVISRTIYEQVAQKTGKTVSEVKAIIENRKKSL